MREHRDDRYHEIIAWVIIIVNQIKILFNDGYNEFRLIKNYNRIHQYTNSITFSCLHISSFPFFIYAHSPSPSFYSFCFIILFFPLYLSHPFLFLFAYWYSHHISSRSPNTFSPHPPPSTDSLLSSTINVIYLSMFINYRR